MGLKLETVLDKNIGTKLLQEAIEAGDIFKDYVPAIVFSEPQPTQFRLSDKGDEVLQGNLQLSEGDVDKMLNDPSKPLSVYIFTLEIDGEPVQIKLDGKQITNNEYNTPAIVKGKEYDILLDDTKGVISSDEETEGGEEGGKVTGSKVFVNIKNNKEFDTFNNNFGNLKKSASNLKSLKLSKYAENPSFRKALVLNLINSKMTNIKVNGEPISVTLKKLYDNKLLEAPKRRDINKKQQLPQGWENQVSQFFAELFKVYSALNKCCKNIEPTNEIKKFFKQLYIITREGKSNYSDEKKRDELFKRIVGNMGNIINYLTKGLQFTNKKQQVENIIKEEEEKKKIIFTDFEIDAEDIEDSFDDFAEKEEINDDGVLDSDEISRAGSEEESEAVKRARAKEIARRGFNLYGKDAGKLFPSLSFKYRDIKSWLSFGLLGRGDFEGRQEKIKDRYGIYNLPGGEEGRTTSITNLPSYLIQFLMEVRYKKGNEFIRFKEGDKVRFNYDEQDKVLIHKTSSKKSYTNQALIYIEMNEKPKLGGDYESKIVKVVPLKGETFAAEPNTKVKFKILDPEKEEKKEAKK